MGLVIGIIVALGIGGGCSLKKMFSAMGELKNVEKKLDVCQDSNLELEAKNQQLKLASVDAVANALKKKC